MTPRPERRIGLLLVPGFSMLSLAGALDAFSLANDAQADARYRPDCLSDLGGLVGAGSSVQVQTLPWLTEADWHAVFVVAATREPPSTPLLAQLQRWAARSVRLGGLGTGAAWLAAAGLLDGQRACADWAALDGLRGDHPTVAWAQGLWDISAGGTRLSCAGGSASLDLCAAWLAAQHGPRLAQALADTLGPPRPRDERQRAPASAQRGGASAKLGEALALMEANLAEPLPTEEVARLVGVSRRQLERLFKQHLDSLPSRHYLALRLARAQRLLQQSSQSILQIGLGSGFSSGPHFSNAYKTHYGHTPRDERKRRALAWRGAGPSGDSTP